VLKHRQQLQEGRKGAESERTSQGLTRCGGQGDDRQGRHISHTRKTNKFHCQTSTCIIACVIPKAPNPLRLTDTYSMHAKRRSTASARVKAQLGVVTAMLTKGCRVPTNQGRESHGEFWDASTVFGANLSSHQNQKMKYASGIRMSVCKKIRVPLMSQRRPADELNHRQGQASVVHR
jgi:hypothetical protein